MIDLLKSKNKIIINSDIDGVLSGIILQNYLGCEIVGFSNSDDKIWINSNQIEHQKEVTFIDIFITHPQLACIDQHIVSVNQKHNETLKNNPLKINPNVIRGRYFVPKESYYKKYPFGTLHFIISALERVGQKLDLDLLSEKEGLKPIDFFLRADDTFYTSKVKYKENAEDWWKWLIDYSKSGRTTQGFYDYIQNFNGKPYDLKKKVETKLKSFHCDKPDGGFLDILNKEYRLKTNFRSYIDFVAQTVQLPTLSLNDNWTIYKGKPERISLQQANFDDFIEKIEKNKIFSYAFVKSFGQPNSLSYTLSIERQT